MNAGGVSPTCDPVAEETRTSRIVWLGFGILLGLVGLLLAIAVGAEEELFRWQLEEIHVATGDIDVTVADRPDAIVLLTRDSH